MSNAADKKRWAILPPPSPNSAKISGEFTLDQTFQRKRPARRTVSGEVRVSVSNAEVEPSFVHELEPSDSERVTEVPASDEIFEIARPQADLGLETIPAPPLAGEDPSPDD